MAWSNDVVRLQEVDLERIKINARCTEIDQALADDEGIAEAKSALAEANLLADGIRKQQETLEFELGKVQSKARLTQEKLYSGRITNSRELQDLQTEGESLKRHSEELEDKILGVMMEREDAEQGVSTMQKALEQIQSTSNAYHLALTQELTTLQMRNQTLSDEREILTGRLPATILDTYTYLLPRTGNRPIAVLNDRQCGVCGIDVSPSNVQKAHHEEEAYCGGCRRLVVNLD